ncbi:MAG: methyl-accepting chemotaxis protein [Actinomycetota bacterium]
MKSLTERLPIPSALKSLKAKILLATLALSIVPMAVVSLISLNRATAALTTSAGQRVEVAAVEAGDKLDRNLFERYGDVQAFAANPKILGTPDEAQEIIDFLTVTYGVYDLMVVADLDGKVIAVNSVDGAGESIDSGSLLGSDVSDQDWFQVVRSGNTPDGGTYYTDAEINPLITELYDHAHVTLPFAAPVYDQNGRLAAVWHNHASFERIVSDIMEDVREEFKHSGAETIETQVLRSDGLLIDDADPSAILEFNLAATGLQAANFAIAGHDGETFGFTQEIHARRGVEQLNGWALTDGALGFPGYDWGILVRQETSEALASDGSLRDVMLAVGLVASVLIAGLSYLLARSIAKPIASVADRAKTIASGTFSVKNMDLNRSDELGDLADSFDDMTAVLNTVGSQAARIANGELSAPELSEEVPGELGTAFSTMVDSLRNMIDQLKGSSFQLAGAAEELTAVSATMGTSAELTSRQATTASTTGDEVSSSVASVATAIEQMNASIREVATNAIEASNVASEAVTVAQTTSDSISKLGESSEEIGNVIKVINSIAEQTNLLALNATIEAARAGEAGKGFAVVANEVKELANQTAKATEEISSRIQNIQTDTAGAVEANLQIGETIDRINEISGTIASAVEEQSVTTAEIGRNVEEAASGTQEIASSINEVAAAAEDTRSSTDGTKESAEEMARMAAELSELVGHYS